MQGYSGCEDMAVIDPKGLASTRNAGSCFQVVESPRKR